MITLKVGLLGEEAVFLVDTGATRSSLNFRPKNTKFQEKSLIISGVKGEGFKVPIFEEMKITCDDDTVRSELLYIPEIGSNLMGRDLIIKCGLGIQVKENQLTVSMAVLTEEQEQQIDPRVWVSEGNRGGLKVQPLKIELKNKDETVRIKQYPISLEGRKGLRKVITGLVDDGLIEPCMSPFNTPILPVRKTDGNFRLVQDLRALNKMVKVRHPVVPNPYSLLSKIPPKDTWFSVVDLKDAFWACPLAKESRDLFAFEWEDPLTGRKQQYRWTVLPQGFTESPNLFGQVLEQVLSDLYHTPGTTTIKI